MTMLQSTRPRGSRLIGALLVASLVWFGSIFGCDSPSSSQHAEPGAGHRSSPSPSISGEQSRDDDPDIRRSEEIPTAPDRIVSLAPNVTETLFALGVGHRVVGVTRYCTYPEEATERPSIGSFAAPDLERILARNPQLVIGVVSGSPRDIYEQLDGSGVAYAFLEMTSISQTLAGIRSIGELVGRPEKGRRLVREIRDELDTVGRRWRNRTTTRPRVLLAYGHDPLVAAGPGTFGHQLIRRAGGRNVLEDAETEFPRLDAEKLLELRPERILDTAAESARRGREFWSGYDMLEAVRDGEVAVLPDPVVLRPGPRLPEALRRVARAVHGTASSSPDAGAER